MIKAGESIYSRDSREWIPVTRHRAGAHTAPNNINIGNGYMVGTYGYPVPMLRWVDSLGNEKGRFLGGFAPTAAYAENDEIHVRVTDLAHISAFYVRYNQIKEMLIDLNLLVNTRTLGFRSNQIANLGHQDLSNLSKLINLDFSNNGSLTGVTLHPDAPINFYYFGGASLTETNKDYILQHAVDGGITGGTIAYDGRPSYDATENWETLADRGWSLGLSPFAGTIERLGETSAGVNTIQDNIGASHKLQFYVRNADGSLRYEGQYGHSWAGYFPDFVEDGYIETEHYHPRIISLEVRGHHLKTLYLSHFVNLVTADFSDNNLQTVNVSTISNLQSLNLRNNPLASLTGVANNNLTFLDVRDTNLGSTAIDSLLADLVATGELNGTFHYDEIPNEEENYDILISRGWTLSLEPLRLVLSITDTRISEVDFSWVNETSATGAYYVLSMRLVQEGAAWESGPLVDSNVTNAVLDELIPNTEYEFKLALADASFQIVKESNIVTTTTDEAEWIWIGYIQGALSFDNYLLSGNSGAMEVAEFDQSVDRYIDPSGRIWITTTDAPIESMPFSSTGGAQADFSFANREVILAVRNVPVGVVAKEIEVGATDVLLDWQFNEDIANPTDVLDFSNQFQDPLGLFDGATELKALTISFRNSLLVSTNVDKVIQLTDTNGKSNGTIDLTGNELRSSDSDISWNNLIAKNWNITTAVPAPEDFILSQGTVTYDSVSLSWTASTNVNSYDVYRRTAGTLPWSLRGSVSSSTTTFTDSNVQASSNYEFKVTAVNASGSTDSNMLSLSTPLAPPSPATGIGFNTIAQTSLNIFWTAGANSVDHMVMYRIAGTTSWSNTTYATNTARNVSGLTAGKNYEWKVVSRNDTGTVDSAIVTQATSQPVSGVDPDYQAVLNFATANGIALPTAAQQTADDTFIKAYKAKAAGEAWAKDDVFFRPASTATPAFKLICWKRKIQMLQVGSLIWTDTGVEGNGANGYIDPLLPLSTATNYKMNDAGVMFYGLKSPAEDKAIVGLYSGVTTDYVLYAPKLAGTNSGKSYGFLNGGAEYTNPLKGIGLNALYRGSNGLAFAYADTVGQDTGTASTSINTNSAYIFARRRVDTSSADIYSTEKIKFLTIGASKKLQHIELNTLTY